MNTRFFLGGLRPPGLSRGPRPGARASGPHPQWDKKVVLGELRPPKPSHRVGGMGKPGFPIPLRGGGVGKPGFPTLLLQQPMFTLGGLSTRGEQLDALPTVLYTCLNCYKFGA